MTRDKIKHCTEVYIFLYYDVREFIYKALLMKLNVYINDARA